jgi:hypothetical protein
MNEDLHDIIFVLKFRKDSICCAPVGEAKVNDIDTIRCDGNTVYSDKNPFGYVLIDFVIPKSERDNLQKQI